MNDLNTINRLNAEAFADSIARYQAQGRYVVAEYTGLHLTAIETFSDEPSAFAKFDSYIGRTDSTRGKLFLPTNNVSVLYPPTKPAADIPPGSGVSAAARPQSTTPAVASDAAEYQVPFTHAPV